MYPVYFFIGIVPWLLLIRPLNPSATVQVCVLIFQLFGMCMVALHAIRSIKESKQQDKAFGEHIYRLVKKRLEITCSEPTKSKEECDHKFRVEYDASFTMAYDWCPICHTLRRKK